MIIHLSFIRNVWISATPSASVTLPFTYPHILALLTSNLLLSMMIASLPSVIQLSLTYPHVPDEAQMNNHQASYLVSIRLILIFSCGSCDSSLVCLLRYFPITNLVDCADSCYTSLYFLFLLIFYVSSI